VHGGEGPFQAFYRCRIRAQAAGPPLPRVAGRLYAQRRLEFYGVRVNTLQVRGGVCMVDLSWPQGHSAYAALVGRDGKKAWRERVVSHAGPRRRRWYFSTSGPGPFFLKLYAKRGERYHQEVAVARCEPVPGAALPAGVAVYSSLWGASKCRLETVKSIPLAWGGIRLEVVVRAPQQLPMLAVMEDGDGKRYPAAVALTRIGERYTFRFSPPAAGLYRIRILGGNARGRYNNLLTRVLRAGGPGEPDLRARYLQLGGDFHRAGLVVLEDGPLPGGYRIRIKSVPGRRLTALLIGDKNRRIRDGVRVDEQDGVYTFLAGLPATGPAQLRLYTLQADGTRRFLGRISLKMR
jgi:hypothetical protein